MTDDDNDEKIVTAVEVREELDEFKEAILKKLRGMVTKISTLEENIETLEHDREDSWEAIKNKVSTLVEDSVSTLNGCLTELEHTVQSQRTTPITDEDDILNVEMWSTMEQAIWSEMRKLREHTQEVPNLYTLCEQLHENQKSQEKRLSGLRNFARQVEQYLERMNRGAAAPRDSRQSPMDGNRPSVSLAYVPGASASSSAVPLSHVQTPTPPTVPAPPISRDEASPCGENASSPEPHRSGNTHFSTVRSEVQSGAIRMDITNPEQWSAGDIAVIRNQEAKRVREIGSLIFETPIQHDYEAGVDVRSLLSSEQLEEIDGRLAVTDVNPSTGASSVRFWVDEVPLSDVTENRDDRGHASIPVMSRHVIRTHATLERREGGSPFNGTWEGIVIERVLISEEEWIIMTMMTYIGNVFPWAEVRAHGGNIFPTMRGQVHLG